MRLRTAGGARYRELYLSRSFRSALRLPAWPVPDPGAAPSGRALAADLYDLLLALPAAFDNDHGKGSARQHRQPLAAREPETGRAPQGLWAWRGLFSPEPPRRQISLSFGWLRHHAHDVDDDLHVRFR